MNVEDFREYCLSIKGSTESAPFLDRNVVVYKVMEKMFVYIPLYPKDGVIKANLKCNPDKSEELREKYNGITETDFKTPMWNLVTLESDVPDKVIEELIRHSAEEVISKLPKSKQEEYKRL